MPHAHRIESGTARILTVATPGGFERLFLEHGAAGDTRPPRPRIEDLVAAVRALRVQPLEPR